MRTLDKQKESMHFYDKLGSHNLQENKKVEKVRFGSIDSKRESSTASKLMQSQFCLQHLIQPDAHLDSPA